MSVRRQLNIKNPDRELPYTFATVEPPVWIYLQTRQVNEALKTLEEASKIGRELASKDPDAYLPKVASILVNLGALHRDLQQLSQAEQSFEDALKIYRQLAARNPEELGIVYPKDAKSSWGETFDLDQSYLATNFSILGGICYSTAAASGSDTGL